MADNFSLVRQINVSLCAAPWIQNLTTINSTQLGSLLDKMNYERYKTTISAKIISKLHHPQV